MRRKWFCRLFCFVIVTVAVLAHRVADAEEGRDDKGGTDVTAGHSYHGEAFNEGPRQKSYLMSGLGRSKFEITTEVEAAQSYFNQGIDQLHGFWYFEAERSFRQVALLDPECAMAYWGLTMANVNNQKRAKEFLAESQEKLKSRTRSITQRERMYIDALAALYDKEVKSEKLRSANFVNALEELVLEFPQDVEAKAFLVCQIWMNQRHGNKIASYVGINSILDDIFAIVPDHPAHHYRIHLWDYKDASIALQSAAKCGPSLPDIAHMWHMPGHIYSRLQRYADAAWQQEASARVDHRNMMHDWVMPDQIHNFAHNNEWCVRNLIHVGRIRNAIELSTNMISMPRHPKYNTLDKRGSYYYGRQRLLQTYATFELWDELINACESGVLMPTNRKSDDVRRLRFLGRAYYRSNQTENGSRILSELRNELKQSESARAIVESETRIEQEHLADRIRVLERKVNRLIFDPVCETIHASFEKALRREYRKRTNAAVTSATKPFDDQINVIKRAIDEMDGYEFLNEKKYKEAVKKFEAAGQVDAIYRAYVLHLAGESEKAIEQARKYADNHKNEIQPLTMLTWFLWEAGEEDAALLSLCELFEVSATIEFDSPFFDRLDPILEFASMAGDWRISTQPADDLGPRPDLDSLGPFRWQPVSAPDWQLIDSHDNVIGLEDYTGQNVLVIFYLGHGCLHCAEQLQEFAPRVQEFQDSGIEVVAISTDDRDGLKKSIESFGAIPLPIQLVANPTMDVFKSFRAYDEFEDQPLHGTFLIDAAGRIRWQDINYEPFMEPEFLLEESRRLLSHPMAR